MMRKSIYMCIQLRRFLCVAALALLTACAPAGESIAVNVPAPDAAPAPAPDAFTVCHGFGCQFTSAVKLKPGSWDWLTADFAAPASSAAEERDRIKAYIARMEIIAGLQAGTLWDKAGTSLFESGEGQLDCEDETVNTTTYLKLLDREGLLVFHGVGAPVGRGFGAGGWPHMTAAIRDRESGILYAVDSWFFDNGEAPFLTPIERWLAGKGPERT